MSLKYKRVKKRHNFERGNLRLIIEACEYLEKALMLIDKAVLRDLLSKRKSDKGLTYTNATNIHKRHPKRKK